MISAKPKSKSPATTTAGPGKTARGAKPRKAGRPSGDPAEHREALLDAAREVFSRAGFAASSLRLIAQQARVTPALAHYYFKDKDGLLLAVVEERVAPLVARIATEVGADAADPEAALSAFVRNYTRTAAENPWLPQLILREVLSAEGVLRAQFISRFAGGMTGLLRAHIERGQRAGTFRRDLDPASTVMSIISLCIFPFIARPLVSEVLKVSVDPAHAESLAVHHLGILMSGLRKKT